MSTPTQVQRPWRATARTIFAALVALAAMLPLLVQASGVDETLGPIAGALAIAGAITRVMARPEVEDFLARFLPFLAADPPARLLHGNLDANPVAAIDAARARGGLPWAPPLVASVACHICPGTRFELPITTTLWGTTTVTDLADITVTAPVAGAQDFVDHMNQHRHDGTFASKLLEHAEQMARRADLIRQQAAE